MRYVVRSLPVLALVVGAVLPAAAADFPTRCQAQGVVKCVAFDAQADITGAWGSPHGVLPGTTTPSLDATVKASGAASIKFTIPSNSGAGSAGSYFTNFSDDFSVQFGENQEFYVQWRQRFSPEFLSTYFTGGDGWKQDIIGTGDKPGCTAANPNNSVCSTSCSALELVNENIYQRGFAQMYNSCTGSTSHGAYDAFEEPYGGADFKLQNGRPSPYCLYSQKNTSYFQPTGNCFGYFPNEWMTFQVMIKMGPRVNDEFTNSYVKLWISREGALSELVINWGPYNLSAGPASESQKYGKVWFLPYNTNKDPSQTHPTCYTWYDELIVSTVRIADPDSSVPTQPPLAPTNVHAR